MEIGEFVWHVIKFMALWWIIWRFLDFCSDLRQAVIVWKERNAVEKELLAVRYLIDKEWLERKSNGN